MRFLSALVYGVAALALATVAAGAMVILMNRLPLTRPPGLFARLHTYLTTHVAQTRADSPFPELRPRVFPGPPDRVYAAVRQAMASLRWKVIAEDAARRQLHAVVTTPLWRFKDDVLIRVEPGPNGGSVIDIRSSSRVGRGDFGTNTRHILNLYKVLAVLLRATPSP